MKNRQVLPAIAGITLALLIVLFFSSSAFLGSLEEYLIGHIVIIAIAAFLAVLGYEDWKDAQRERINKGHRSSPC